MVALYVPLDYTLYHRALTEELQRQAKIFSELKTLKVFTNATQEFLLVLNTYRQIVFYNDHYAKFMNASDQFELIGLRPGESLNCVHANLTPFGCGTSEFCTSCGLNKSISACQLGMTNSQETRLSTSTKIGSLDFRVKSTPFEIEGEVFTIFTMVDISADKRKQVFENIFFHDLLNTAGGLLGYASLLQDAEEENIREYHEAILQLAQNTCDEIQSQRQLAAAENHEIDINPTILHSRTLLNSIIETYKHHSIAEGKRVFILEEAQDFVFVSDEVLIRRVLGNLTKNALESSQPGESVLLGCSRKDNRVEFWVHNNCVIPYEIKLQMFQRSFSTKGSGRGLGTYSVRLLTEQYLHGKVSFDSSNDIGTIFKIILPESVEQNFKTDSPNIIPFVNCFAE